MTASGAPVGPPGARAPAWLPLVLVALWMVEFLVLAWAPTDRQTWLLENLLVVPLVLWLVLARRRLPLSSAAWGMIFAFLALHEVGSHFTYSQVPWTEWCERLVGRAPSSTRNHYDRFVHFAFGLLWTRPLRELLADGIRPRPALLRLLTICVVATLSVAYELLEWGAAVIVDPELGIGFVGAQGDVWDAQKDTSLALLGALCATGLDWRNAARHAAPG